jgi:4,5-dihydroxyphthalate decarboxylase
LIVTVAAGRYAHLSGLASGAFDDGLEVRYEAMEPGHVFPRMLRDEAWDAAEMSLATAYILADKGDRRFVGLPVFPSRTFRHSALYVATGSRLESASGLRGARIGVLRYAMTTAVWVRDLLAGQYGVPAASLQWLVGEESPHPESVAPRVVDGGMAALEKMAVAGEIDCLLSGRAPAAFAEGGLRRLFPDFGAEEKAYYARTQVFPIMHTIVVRRALAERAPDAIRALRARFEAAKSVAEKGLADFDVSTYPLPWLPAYVEDARKHMGASLWPYGIEPNRPTLEAFGAALAAEGLTRRAWAPEELFEHD